MGHPTPRSRLKEVIPVALTRSRHGVDVTLLSLELYETGFRLLYRVQAAPEGPDEILLPALSFVVRDDAGNTYPVNPTMASGYDGDWLGSAHGGPKPAPEDQVLNVTVTGIQWFEERRGEEIHSREIQGRGVATTPPRDVGCSLSVPSEFRAMSSRRHSIGW